MEGDILSAFGYRVLGFGAYTRAAAAGGFPQVQTEADTPITTSTTSHTITMPSGIATGDLLIAMTSIFSTTISAFDSGRWTNLYTTTNSVLVGACYWREADGTEVGTITMTTAANTGSANHIWRIDNMTDPSTTPPEVETSVTGNTDVPDPPSLSPSWGAADTLWLALAHSHVDEITGFPTDYTNTGAVNAPAGGGDETNVGWGRNEVNASSENPGTFTMAAADQWIANTLAVRPT